MTSQPAVLSRELFTILTSLVEERVGISYDARDKDLFVDKVAGRAREAGFESLLDYYYYLRYDEGSRSEFDALVDSLVVHESYFFREATPLNAVVEHLLCPAVAAGRRPRVWSAACSAGEEPLTLAMILEGRGLLGKVDIVASDVTLHALREARETGWSPRALRALPTEVLGRWIQVVAGRGRVDPSLIAAIDWQRVNLVDQDAIAALGAFDVVLCRNVLIYFSDATVVRVVGSLAGALRPGGYLVVGASESLLRFGTLLESEERGGAFLYRKGSP